MICRVKLQATSRRSLRFGPSHRRVVFIPSISLISIWHVAVRVAGIGELLLNRGNCLNDPRRRPQGDGVGWQALCHSRAGTNSASPANSNPRKNGDIPPNPAVILDADGVAKLYKLDAGKHTCLVPSSVYVNIGAHLHPVTNNDKACVQDGQPICWCVSQQ